MLRAPKTLDRLLAALAPGLAVLLCSACFDVEAPQIYRCSAAEPACPPGLTCRSGLCAINGAVDAASDLSSDTTGDAQREGPSTTDATQEAAPDMAADAAPDTSVDTAPSPDLSKPDLSISPDVSTILDGANDQANSPDGAKDGQSDTST